MLPPEPTNSASRPWPPAPVYTDEEIEDFENLEGYDFC